VAEISSIVPRFLVLSCLKNFPQPREAFVAGSRGAGVEEWPAGLAHGEFYDGGSALALLADAKNVLQPVDRDRPAEQIARDRTQTLSPSPDSACKINRIESDRLMK
jgi:hypothetical protein